MQTRPNGPGAGPSMEELIEAARGSLDALGQLLELCRPYLLLVANKNLGAELQAKISPSDLVQETFAAASPHFARFTGRTEAELIAWLRRILLNRLATEAERYTATEKRQIGREVAEGNLPAGKTIDDLSDPGASPSARVLAQEQEEQLEKALAQLPEHYRQVIRWRNDERLTFGEIGQRLGSSEEAARKVWVRALEQLEDLLEPPHASG
jgi:RNA polymerase sigma-70 factor (ECF subfamily)